MAYLTPVLLLLQARQLALHVLQGVCCLHHWYWWGQLLSGVPVCWWLLLLM